MSQVVQILGALAILAAFVAAQLGISRATLYNALGRARNQLPRVKAS